MTHSISLEPKYFGPGLNEIIRAQLYRQIEGTCTGQHGYILAIVSVDRIGSGVIADTGASASFEVGYTAILLRPFRNEVVDGIVESVNKMGFFASVGPLQVFVSSHHVPGDFRFEPTALPPCYMSDEAGLRIGPGDHVRLKIYGTRIDATEIVLIVWIS